MTLHAEVQQAFLHRKIITTQEVIKHITKDKWQ